MFSGAPDKDSLQPNREELLRMGIQTAKAGNIENARLFFQRVLNEDKRNERAMMWMAKLAESKMERKKWLERVLAVNPDNEAARKHLNKLLRSDAAKQNRVLLMFGVVAGVLIVLLVVVVLYLSLPR